MNQQTAKPWIVLKFGGSSVGQAANWQVIKQQVELQLDAGKRPFLVLSALKNVSNLLEALLHQALAGVHPLAIKHLKQHHLNFAAQLDLTIQDQLSPWFEQLSQACQAIYQQQTISPQSHAQVLAFGELLSTTIGAAFLNQQKLNTQWLDARNLLKANNGLNQHSDNMPDSLSDPWHHFTSSQCDYEPSADFEQRLQDQIKLPPADQADVIITQGFIASDHNQHTVLLGREGSDTSAAYFGSLLKAEQVQIWTDVPGVFSTNPQQNNQARQLPQLSFTEAAQMAKFGAKVLHPRALKPVSEANIAVMVKSTLMPNEAGSLINADTNQAPLIKAVVVQSPVIAIESNSQVKNSANQEQVALLTERLLLQGYDQVLLNDDKVILRYVNSDRAEPEIETLNPDNACLTYKDKTLISIIGNSINSSEGSETPDNSKSEQDWIAKVKTYCLDHLAINTRWIFTQPSVGRISVLVDAAQHQKVANALHQFFIVDAKEQQGWGKSWQQYCHQQKA